MGSKDTRTGFGDLPASVIVERMAEWLRARTAAKLQHNASGIPEDAAALAFFHLQTHEREKAPSGLQVGRGVSHPRRTSEPRHAQRGPEATTCPECCVAWAIIDFETARRQRESAGPGCAPHVLRFVDVLEQARMDLRRSRADVLDAWHLLEAGREEERELIREMPAKEPRPSTRRPSPLLRCFDLLDTCLATVAGSWRARLSPVYSAPPALKARYPNIKTAACLLRDGGLSYREIAEVLLKRNDESYKRFLVDLIGKTPPRHRPRGLKVVGGGVRQVPPTDEDGGG